MTGNYFGGLILLLIAIFLFVVSNNLNSFEPRAGLNVLPNEVYASLHLAKKHNISELVLSRHLSKNAYVRQRLVEGLYPVLVKKTSPNIIMVKKEFESSKNRKDFIYIDEFRGIYYCRIN